jgi:hypothetical protein
MAHCAECGEKTSFPLLDPRNSFTCDTCGQSLKGTFRARPFFLGISTAASLALRAATIVVNPRLNPRKDSELATAIELGLMRLLWTTRFVQVKAVNLHPLP